MSRFEGRLVGMKSSLLLAALFTLTAPVFADDLRQHILADPKSFYYVDFAHYPKADRSLPVGVFDSGTGGLTVLNAMLNYDEHDNASGKAGADGVPDLQKEDLIYLADQANMPYGNYAAANKTDLLVEHVLKAAQFLLGSRYYAAGPAAVEGKKPVKAIVVACNTATAYAKTEIEDLLQRGGSDLKVIGVIDAGCRGALSALQPDEDGTIAVFATAGTVASGGYERSLRKLRAEQKCTGKVTIYSQGGTGVAEAVDEDSAFVQHDAKAPRSEYRGPGKSDMAAALMPAYNFDRSGNGVLEDAECSCLQLNSSTNYVRYHLVNLLEQMRKDPQAQPLKALILGCTHYPYLRSEIAATLARLRNYQQGGAYPYRRLIAEQVTLVDPALNTARELYDHLQSAGLANSMGSWANTEFYITVPARSTEARFLENNGSRFTYDYKYARSAGANQQYVEVVPFSRRNIPAEVAARLQAQVPKVYELMQQFARSNAKTAFLSQEDRF